jgi:hypothetical protein
VGVLTVGYALYKVLKIPFPESGVVGNDKTVLIYGGSTATGPSPYGLQSCEYTGSTPGDCNLSRAISRAILISADRSEVR